MPGRSPHRQPPSSMMSSRRSPVLRGRIRSPMRRRPGVSGPPRLRRPADFRSSSARSRSPIVFNEKVRSVSPPLKRNLSPKNIRETTRRPLAMPPRKLSRSKSPISAPRLPSYKPGPSTSSNSDRYRSGSYERERVQFRGPEGSIAFDINELKKIAVEIRRARGTEDDNAHINRSINQEEIAPVRRPGMRGREIPSNFPDSTKPEWAQEGSFRRQKDFQSESSRPMVSRSEYVAESARDRPSDEYRRIVAINSAQGSGIRSEQEKARPRDIGRYSPPPLPPPPPRYEERSRPYYPTESRERPRSPGYSTSRRSPPRTEFFEGREKMRDDRRGSSRDDLRHELDLRKRDDGRYPERHSSYERESDLRTRILEKRIESHSRPEERHFERDRKRNDHLSPPPLRRRGSMDSIRPTRGDGWEREHERESGGERRKRPHSREREDGRFRGNGRERFDDFDAIKERPRRFPFKPESRGYIKDDDDYTPSPIRGRGGPSMRRGYSGPFRSRSMRGPPRGFRGSRGGPPRGAFTGIRGGYHPRD